MTGLRNEEYSAIKTACRALGPPSRDYLEPDFVSNLILTVLDYQLHNKIVTRAYEHYRTTHWNQVRTLRDLKFFLSRFVNDSAGNQAAAVSLWGYKYSKRMGQLRELVEYFESIGVVDQESLRQWAATNTFEEGFSGRVKGLGFAVCRWLLIRVGVQTIKPDVHVKRFIQGVIGRVLSDEATVAALEQVARELGHKAYELDWAIWEHQRGAPGAR